MKKDYSRAFIALAIWMITCSVLSISSANGKTVTHKISHSGTFASLLDSYYEDSLEVNPIDATYAGDKRYNAVLLNDLSLPGRQQIRAHFQAYRDALTHFPDRKLTDEEQHSKAILEWEIDINLANLSFNSHLTPIDQTWSDNLVLEQFASGEGAQPFDTVEDYDNWLRRVDDYLDWLASAKSKMELGIEKDYVLPKALIVKTLPNLKEMAETPLEQHVFFGPIRNLPEAFTDQQKQELTAAYSKMVTEKVIPAYRKLYQFMAGDYLEAGRDTHGVGALKNGYEFYQHQIRKYTMTDMTADEIHVLGLSEVARILAEMETVKQQVGFEGDLKSFFDFVRQNKQLKPYTEHQQIIDHYQAIHAKMQPHLDKLFDVKPKTKFEIRRTEAFREQTASPEYSPGSLDGSRPGVFYVPIPNPSEYNIFDSESLFLHEAIPGHHYQDVIAKENKLLPKFRQSLWYTGFGEGWALYAESLGDELGLYTDPYQRFGKLSAEMHRAIRLVVDTGIHTKGWTREQAIQYSLENEAEPLASIINEVERYMANPGQALAYKIGQLKIRELRNYAENELGDSFNIAEFHNQVLESGCLPLALLENKITAWVLNAKAVAE